MYPLLLISKFILNDIEEQSKYIGQEINFNYKNLARLLYLYPKLFPKIIESHFDREEITDTVKEIFGPFKSVKDIPDDLKLDDQGQDLFPEIGYQDKREILKILDNFVTV